LHRWREDFGAVSQKVIRKLTTILAADAQSFSTAMTRDELGTYTDLQAARNVFFKLIERHGGRVANTAGDGLIADFPSVVEAVHCATEVQQELTQKDSGLRFRIGLHLGDVICDGDDLIGEGVNLAARLQTMADPGGVLISQQVYDQVRNKLSVGFEFLGDKRPRNMVEDIPVYRLALGQPINIAPEAASAAPKRRSRVSQVWSDPEPEIPTPLSSPSTGQPPQSQDDLATGSSAPRPGVALSPQAKVKRLRYLGLGTGAAVLLNMISGGSFWPAWPIVTAAGLYGLHSGAALLGQNHIKGISLNLWVIAAFLVCVNLMTWSGTPWALWPLSGLLAVGVLARKKQTS
jgi:adenylate cyclase